MAQKKPLVKTSGLSRPGGIRTPNQGIMSPLDEICKYQQNQPLTQTQNSSSSASGSAPNEPVSQIASDSVLADLVGDGTSALDSTLPPDIRFMVKQWPTLSEDTQRAVLAIVRAADSQADSSEQNRPACSVD